MKSFSDFLNENTTHGGYKLGDKVTHGGVTHNVVKLEADGEKIWIRKARRDWSQPHHAKSVHHSEVTPYVKPPDQDTSHHKTCQVCGRSHQAKKGLIAHHGYQRPGDGQQTRSCDGARHLPFEVSRDVLGMHIEDLHRWHAKHKDQEHHLRNTNEPVHTMEKKSFRDSPELVEWKPDHPEYKHKKERLIAKHRDKQKLLAMSIEHQQQRYDNWKPKE